MKACAAQWGHARGGILGAGRRFAAVPVSRPGLAPRPSPARQGRRPRQAEARPDGPAACAAAFRLPFLRPCASWPTRVGVFRRSNLEWPRSRPLVATARHRQPDCSALPRTPGERTAPDKLQDSSACARKRLPQRKKREARPVDKFVGKVAGKQRFAGSWARMTRGELPVNVKNHCRIKGLRASCCSSMARPAPSAAVCPLGISRGPASVLCQFTATV